MKGVEVVRILPLGWLNDLYILVILLYCLQVTLAFGLAQLFLLPILF